MAVVNGTGSYLEGLVFEPSPPVKDDDDKSESDKGKGKTTAQDDDDSTVLLGHRADVGNVNWTLVEQPEALTCTADTENDIILEIITQSIENIKARILQQEQERQGGVVGGGVVDGLVQEEPAQEETLPGYEEIDRGKGPEVVVDAKKEKSDDQAVGEKSPGYQGQDIEGSAEPKMPSPESRARRSKRTLLGFFKKLNNSPELGESSSTGALRNGLLTSHIHAEHATYSARRRFVLDLIKRSTGEETSPSPPVPVEEPEVECVSCLDDFKPGDTIKAPCHHYCKPCFERLITSACQNEQQWPPKCCLNAIPDDVITASVGERTAALYHERAVEWSIKVSDRIYCSRPECSLFIPPESVLRSEEVAECRGRHLTCIICRQAQHYGEECPQDRDLASTSRLAEDFGWRRCPGCRAFVEHSDACQHMTCRCGAQFCYVCGATWRTCACSLAMLRSYKARAEKRREEREREEERVREAIWLVEEYEREQALKAEMLRQEQLRKEEERRREELEERIRREAERRRDIASKFTSLRQLLHAVNETQMAAVCASHREAERALTHKAKADMAALLEQQAAERELLQQRLHRKVAAREQEAQAEYAARVAEEKLIEDGYRAKLSKYWAWRPNGEEAVAAAMRDLRRSMDRAFEVWQKHTNEQLDACAFRVREELDIRQELADEKRRRLEESAREEEEVLVRRIVAELRWVTEVVQEREHLLDAKELEELEQEGEDIGAWFDEDLSGELLRLETLSASSAGVAVVSDSTESS
ncbi:hypothetical protein F5Y17DRAFT_294723 [Xylariaceae sp. FL0594]|nr:hypothetical protein F5Y17DRAFT_294723 [Xylariaceae sp. FL0594]